MIMSAKERAATSIIPSFCQPSIHYNFENIGSVEWIAVITFGSVDRRLSVLVLFCWRVPVLFTSDSECESVQ